MSDTTMPTNVEVIGDLVKLTHGGESMFLDVAGVFTLAPALYSLAKVLINLDPAEDDDTKADALRNLDDAVALHAMGWHELT